MKTTDSFIFKFRPLCRAMYAITLPVLGASLLAMDLQAAPPPENSPWKTGHILVKPMAGLPDAEFNRILDGHGGKAIGKLRNLDVHRVSVPAQAEDAVARALSRNPHVKFAEKDLLVETAETTPNDPRYADAWHLPKIQASVAWDHATAAGVTIAILDSGVDGTHPDLISQLVPGWNSVSGNQETADINGHGTRVAGTAAAATNNGIGVAGIAWNAEIMPIRISNRSDGYAYFSDIANGLTWAADHGADVANISYNASNSSSISSAAQYMRRQGGLVVVAAGNDGSDPGWSDNPAIISVSATTSSDTRASWSNYGSYIDVAAPGSGIRTTSSGGGYGSASGTSFASPATAGVVALIMGANPGLSPDEVESILEASADDPVDNSDWHAYYGHGRVNAAAAVQLALNSSPMDYEAPTVAIFSPSSGSTANGLVTVEVNASDNTGVTEVGLYADNQLVGTDTAAPYQFSWDSTGVADGEVTLTSYAHDAAGNQGNSNDVAVIVDNTPDVADTTPPTVAISDPADGSTVSRTVRITVSAWDEFDIASLRLFIDGESATVAPSDLLSYDWNTRKVASGTHTIRAEAIDTAGNTATRSIQVTTGSGGNTGGGGNTKGKGRKN